MRQMIAEAITTEQTTFELGNFELDLEDGECVYQTGCRWVTRSPIRRLSITIPVYRWRALIDRLSPPVPVDHLWQRRDVKLAIMAVGIVGFPFSYVSFLG